MRDYIEITGKTEEEAIRKGLAQLGLDRDDVSIEILERAKAGFLGFGSAPAKIRMSYGPDKPEPIPEAVAASGSVAETVKTPERVKTAAGSVAEAAPEVETAANVEAGREETASERPEPRERKRRERRKRAPKADARPDANPDAPSADADASESPADADALPALARPDAETPSGKNKRGRNKNQDRRKSAPKPVEPDAVPDSPPDSGAFSPTEEVNDEKAQAIRAFLSGLLEHMECPAEIRVYHPEEGRYKVILEGEGMGALIGRRGETLDAIQQLTNYSVNRNGNRVRIQLDAEGYREKREQSLQNLARKEASKVVKYRRSRTLEPMNAYERHVIHTALQDVAGVNTYSTGVDPNRRVVIAYDRDKT